jgi:hypothetical protein
MFGLSLSVEQKQPEQKSKYTKVIKGSTSLDKSSKESKGL